MGLVWVHDLPFMPGVQVRFQLICGEVKAAADRFLRDLPRPAIPSSADLTEDALLQWAEEAVQVEALVKQQVDAAFSSAASTEYLSKVLAGFRMACHDSPVLKHLVTFHETMERRLSDRMITALSRAKGEKDELVKDAMQHLLYTSELTTFHDLEVRISRCIVKHIIANIKVQRFVIPDSFKFSEDADTAQKRSDLQAKHARLEHANDVISQIHEAFNPVHGGKWMEKTVKKVEPIKEDDVSSEDEMQQALPTSHAASAETDRLYDEHVSASPSFRGAAQVHADLEAGPLSSSASDLGFVNVP